MIPSTGSNHIDMTSWDADLLDPNKAEINNFMETLDVIANPLLKSIYELKKTINRSARRALRFFLSVRWAMNMIDKKQARRRKYQRMMARMNGRDPYQIK